ncbi:DUF294 nucleotidyltransferase-like domain-containing protein [Paenibacillus chartarius]|uniref:DUF294 nucleotidyltransferase-like domain-containing protein n=1 Tax=Paenibacillus chartarius TaxID=747481 RepID=A0ABV6DMA4_9BACL
MVRHLGDQVLERIARAEEVQVLRAIRDSAHEVYRDPLLFDHFDKFHIELNRLHDALIRRAIELAVRQVDASGVPSPGLPFAFLLFGSGGRGEQTLWSDQDNGIVFADPGSEEEAELAGPYFELLAHEIHTRLFVLGYPPCSGEVLARNPMWRKSYRDYSSMVRGWLEEPNWEHIRYFLIYSDLRCIYGDEALADKLKQVHLDYVKEHPPVLRALLHNTLHHKVSLGVFGQLITERYGEDAGGVDIKYGAYIPIVNGIRLLAIQAGVAHSGTLERIDALERIGAVNGVLADEWRAVTKLALKLRAMTPFQMENDMYTTRGKLPAQALTKQRRIELKRCLRCGLRLQRYVRHAVKGDDR